MSALAVTISPTTKLRNILFTTDFSEQSMHAVPYLTAIAKKLGWQDLEFVFTDLDARNELEEAQIEEILLRNGVLTINEVRTMRGLPPL